MQRHFVQQGAKNVVREYHQDTITPMLPFNSQLKEQINNVHMVVSPLWRGPSNIHGFALDGNHTAKDGLLIKHQLPPPLPI